VKDVLKALEGRAALFVLPEFAYADHAVEALRPHEPTVIQTALPSATIATSFVRSALLAAGSRHRTLRTQMNDSSCAARARGRMAETRLVSGAPHAPPVNPTRIQWRRASRRP
jgi:hypothetical protein